jgi:hypothetical protein
MKRAARDGAAIAAVLLVASGAVAGCNVLVGVGDYSVGDAEADGTSGAENESGTPVDAGSDQSIGARDGQGDGAGGQGDAPADSRNDRVDSSAVDARPLDTGADRVDSSPPDSAIDVGIDVGSPVVEAGPPPTCGQAIPTGPAFASLVNACVLATGCEPLEFAVSLSDCITNDSLHAVPGFACLPSITSCLGATNSYYSCVGTRAASECASTTVSSCSNNVAVDCFFGSATNCGPTGGTCETYTDSNGNSRADCAVLPTCMVTDESPQCSGNTSYTCLPPTGVGTAGVGFGLSCTGIDATCTSTTSGGTGCYYNGSATCGNLGAATCSDATTLQACTSTGQQFNYDCSRAGGTCATDTLGDIACVSPGCSPTSTCMESCDGNHTVTVCVGGVSYAIDCTQHGNFTSCGVLTDGNVYCI